ncbi:Protein cordon-bleu [Myotis brandtii]|uniref:Protein cordon-bleu n=1 Tax=Myotis brandtii TaxID=109478 RepID=S7QAJ8_MYOBR|nr:Protein cordon-bleu [Myotis brandtii]
MMDLLVELCLQNHLNPSHHALEVWPPEAQQPLSFKPNTLVGTLNVHTVFLKEKVPDEKAKPGPPKVPEKSVRLVVNYLRTQKAVVRVSPEVPLHSLLPVICAKCDVSPEHVVLLRDNVAGEELELSKSLSELGIKELYAWDNKRETFRKSSFGSDETDKEKKKFLGFFKVNKRSNGKGSLTTPNSPSVTSRSITLGPSLSLSNISGVSVKSDMKKRRAPPPPSLPGAGPPAQDKASEKESSPKLLTGQCGAPRWSQPRGARGGGHRASPGERWARPVPSHRFLPVPAREPATQLPAAPGKGCSRPAGRDTDAPSRAWD